VAPVDLDHRRHQPRRLVPARLLVHAGTDLSHEVRTGLGVGFLGGFTTLATLTNQTVLEADGGRPGVAL
jgi:fluoride ion exporter CrcB/FEX